jgi:hypothetical protein
VGLASRNSGRRLSAYRELDHGRVVLYTISSQHTAGDGLLYGLWTMDATYLLAPWAIAFLRLRKGFAPEALPLSIVPDAGPPNEDSE